MHIIKQEPSRNSRETIQSLKVLGIILLIFFLFADKDGDGRLAYFLFDYFDLELSNIFEIALNSILVLVLYLFLMMLRQRKVIV